MVGGPGQFVQPKSPGKGHERGESCGQVLNLTRSNSNSMILIYILTYYDTIQPNSKSPGFDMLR